MLNEKCKECFWCNTVKGKLECINSNWKPMGYFERNNQPEKNCVSFKKKDSKPRTQTTTPPMTIEKMTNEELVDIYDGSVYDWMQHRAIHKELLSRLSSGERAIKAMEKINFANKVWGGNAVIQEILKDWEGKNE
jgi:hypothetical protein